MKAEEIKKAVQSAYGKIAKEGGPCCKSAKSCCGGGVPIDGISRKVGYSDKELTNVPEGANLGLGCGNPLALASLKPGETVLDLGSGAGFDCFIAADQVGRTGKVIGVDMTPEMVARARENALKGNYGNTEFRLGEIEDLPVLDSHVDIVISNCVINLSLDKLRVFKEAFRVLKPGGRLMVSDIVLLREIPDVIKSSIDAYIGCLAGAVSKDQYLAQIEEAGFVDVEINAEDALPIEIVNLDPIAEALAGKIDLSAQEMRRLADSVVSIKVSAVKPAESREGCRSTGSRDYFDKVAGQWDVMREGFFTDSVRDKALAAIDATPGRTAADIGAGTGFISEWLIRAGLQVIAVDRSQAMLDVMRKKFGTSNLIDCRLSEGERLPIPDGGVDYSFANMYLHHVESPPEAIAEMVRILRPGGKLVITDLDEHDFHFLKVEHRDRWMGFKRTDIRHWLTESGLKDTTLDCVGENCCTESECGSESARISIFIATGTK